MKLPLKAPVFGAFIHISVESPAEFKNVLHTVRDLGCLGRSAQVLPKAVYRPPVKSVATAGPMCG